MVGAPAKATPKLPDIKGIQTPNPTTIVFRLKRPSGVFVSALALPATAPVPRDYAQPFDSQVQSTYGLHQVATGPYMIKSDASGNINGVGYQPGELIELVRNSNWSARTSWRPAYANEVLFKEGYQDPTVMTKTILSGSADVNGDSPPPPAELRSILANPSQRHQLFFTPTGGSRYVALNTRKPPFDKLAVRQAVAYVLDRNAMRLTRGGAVDGRIATHFIDPGFKGQGVHAGGRQRVQPVPERRLLGRRGEGQGSDEAGRLQGRNVQRPAGDDGRGQLAARVEHRPGRRRRRSIAALPPALLRIGRSSMARYIGRRIVLGAALLVVVSALTFLIFYSLPSPIRQLCGRDDRRLPS